MMHDRHYSISRSLVDWQVDKLILTLAVMIGLPLMVHALPVGRAVNLGQRWIPIFYAALWAAYFFRPHVAFGAALYAPLANRLITGNPAAGTVQMLTVELLVFVAIIYFVFRPRRYFWISGFAAYAVAKIVSILLFEIILSGASWSIAAHEGLQSVMTAWPGLCVLTVISCLIGMRRYG